MQFIQAVTEIMKCGRPIVSEQTESIFLNVFTQTQMNPPKNPTSKEFMGKYYQTVKELIFQSDSNGVRAKKKEEMSLLTERKGAEIPQAECSVRT